MTAERKSRSRFHSVAGRLVAFLTRVHRKPASEGTQCVEADTEEFQSRTSGQQAASLKARAAEREERLSNIVIGGITLCALVVFVMAVLAIIFMK